MRPQASSQSTEPASPAHPESAADHWAEDSLHYRRVLRELVDMSAAVAQKLHRQAEAQAENTASEYPPPDIILPLERITRIIRRTVALARKVAEPLPAAPAEPRAARLNARHRIIREVEDVISKNFDGAAAENLRDDLFCRLENPDLDDEIDHRPIPELVAELCRDLGLSSGPEPWKHLPDQALEELDAHIMRPRLAWPEASEESSSFLKKRTKKLQ